MEQDKAGRRDVPDWVLLSCVKGVLVFALIWRLASLVSRDYEPVKSIPINMMEVEGNRVACVEGPPITAIMATAWEKWEKYNLGMLGEQYFIMGSDNRVKSVWSRSETLYHLEDPDWTNGDNVCVVYGK